MQPVDAVPIDTIVEVRAACPDADRAGADLTGALARVNAPRRQPGSEARWTVTLRITNEASGPSARATIVDDAGDRVAERTLSVSHNATCVPLAQAVGVWASMVLDDEMARAKDREEAKGSVRVTAPSSTAASSAPSPAAGASSKAPVARAEPIARTATEVEEDEVAPENTERTELGGHRIVEIGLGGYARSTGDGGVAGGAPFVSVEVAPRWFLRSSAGYGRATRLAHLFLRGDVCRRHPGNYWPRRGLELDACAGADVAYLEAWDDRDGHHVDASAPRVTLGPSVILRGELGAEVALELRGIAGVNVLGGSLLSPPQSPLMASAELGVSWRLP